MWEIYYSNDGQEDPWHANRISREDKQESVVIVGTHGWLRFVPLSISSAEWLLLKTIWSVTHGGAWVFLSNQKGPFKALSFHLLEYMELKAKARL